MENEDRLFTPSNIKVRYEFISGFGFNELFTTVIVSSIFGAIVFLINLIMQNNYNAVLAVSIFAVAVAMAVRKNDMNQSITDLVRLSVQYRLKQQSYKYTYYNRHDRKWKYEKAI